MRIMDEANADVDTRINTQNKMFGRKKGSQLAGDSPQNPENFSSPLASRGALPVPAAIGPLLQYLVQHCAPVLHS